MKDRTLDRTALLTASARLRLLPFLLVLPGCAGLRVGRRSAVTAGLLGPVTLPHALTPSPAVAAAVTEVSPLCDPCVTIVKSARGQEITLVGTAHISEDSAALVSRVIRAQHPDVVMIELDQSRAAKLIDRAPPTLKLADLESAHAHSDSVTGMVAQGQRPRTTPTPPPSAPTYSLGSVAGRVLRGDLEEAKAEAIGAGLSSLYRQVRSYHC